MTVGSVGRAWVAEVPRSSPGRWKGALEPGRSAGGACSPPRRTDRWCGTADDARRVRRRPVGGARPPPCPCSPPRRRQPTERSGLLRDRRHRGARTGRGARGRARPSVRVERRRDVRWPRRGPRSASLPCPERPLHQVVDGSAWDQDPTPETNAPKLTESDKLVGEAPRDAEEIGGLVHRVRETVAGHGGSSRERPVRSLHPTRLFRTPKHRAAIAGVTRLQPSPTVKRRRMISRLEPSSPSADDASRECSASRLPYARSPPGISRRDRPRLTYGRGGR